MSYTVKNFKTKKQVKEAIKEGEEVRCYQPGLGPNLSNHTGVVYLEGPHFPEPHRWYGKGEMQEGLLVKIS